MKKNFVAGIDGAKFVLAPVSPKATNGDEKGNSYLVSVLARKVTTISRRRPVAVSVSDSSISHVDPTRRQYISTTPATYKYAISLCV